MNVIVSNKYQSMLEGLNIEIIKSLNGQFDVDELVENFKNFFFQRMILDITALKDYTDISTIQKLSLSLDMEKVILLLDESSDTTSPQFMSNLISMGIYNFTTNVDGILYLYSNPNSYRDVAHLHIINPVQQVVQNVGQPETVYVDRYIDNGPVISGPRIIGIKNVTKQSGATSLVYMMKKQLSTQYKVSAIEVEKSDFRFFNDRELITVNNSNINTIINKNNDKDVILLDINNSKNAEALCGEIIYLIEPSMVKLNRLMIVNPKALNDLKAKKVILNQSLLSSKDVHDFESEARVNIFYNMPPLDERAKNQEALIEFLVKLGFTKLRK